LKITRWQLSGALALLLAACQQQRPAPAPDNGAAPTPQAKAQASPPASNAASLPEPLMIDPEPSAGNEPTIVARETTSVNGKPACTATVRYVGAQDQPVTWNGEDCAQTTALFISEGKLRELQRFDGLAEEVRDDIARSSGVVFYVEGQFSSAIYPLNSAKQIYTVPLAD
jgi:hypothetical protein